MHMEGMAGTSGVEPVEDYVRAPIPQKQEVLVPSGYEGYGFGQKGKRRIIKSVFDSFRKFEVEASKKLFSYYTFLYPNFLNRVVKAMQVNAIIASDSIHSNLGGCQIGLENIFNLVRLKAGCNIREKKRKFNL